MIRPWTEEEIAALREHYPSHGPRWEGWSELLPGRSYSSIASRASVLGAVTRHLSPGRWSAREDERLVELARSGATARECSDALPGRSLSSVYKRLELLGLGNAAWTEGEDEGLAALVEAVARRLGRTPEQVAGRALTLARRRCR